MSRAGIAVAAPSVAVAGTALAFTPWADDAFGLSKLLVVLLATALGWVAWAKWPRVPLGTVERLALAYVGVVGVATVTSIGRYDSFFGSAERYGGLLSLLVFVALGALILSVHRERPDVVGLLPWGFAAGAVGTAAYVLLQTAGIDFLDWRDASGNPVRFQAGTMGNPDFTGGLLGIALPFFVLLVARQAGRVRLAAATATVVVVAALFATRSRGGLLAAVVGLVVLAGVERRRLPRHTRVAFAVAGAAAVVAVASLFVFRPAFVERTELLRTESVAARGRQWAGAWSVFRERPVLGTGPDTFEFAYPEHRPQEDGRLLGLQIADKPHNVLLEKATDTGVVGLAVYLALLAAVVASARRALPTHDDDDRLLLAAFLAAGAAYVAQGVVSIDVPPLAAIGWVLLAAVVALSRSKPRKSSGRRQDQTEWRTITAVVVAVAIGSAGLTTALEHNPTQAAHHVAKGFEAERTLAESRRRADYERAVDHYDRARRMQPRGIPAVVGLARTHTLAGRVGNPDRFTDADRWWRRAVQLDPQDWEVHNGYGLMLNSWANARRGDPTVRRRAVAQLESAVRIKPDHVPAWLNLAKLRSALADRDSARQAVDRALRLQPGNPEAEALAERIDDGQGSPP